MHSSSPSRYPCGWDRELHRVALWSAKSPSPGMCGVGQTGPPEGFSLTLARLVLGHAWNNHFERLGWNLEGRSSLEGVSKGGRVPCSKPSACPRNGPNGQESQ